MFALLVCLGVTASAASYGNFEYEIADNEVTITGYNSEIAKLEIPVEINGYPVTKIGMQTFQYRNDLEEVILPEGIKEIDDGAFCKCENLSKVNIPDSTNRIGSRAFVECYSLDNISIPDGVTSIGEFAFHFTAHYYDKSNWEDNVLYIDRHLVATDYGVPETYIIKEGTLTIAGQAFDRGRGTLKHIIIPDGVVTIGNAAFAECRKLESVVMSDSVTDIGNSAFGVCENLTSVNISKNIKILRNGVFSACFNLENIVLPEGLEVIESALCWTAIKNIIIPDSVKKIDGAFSDCKQLTSITFGENVNEIGYGTLNRCISLEKVIIENPDCNINFEEYTFPENAVIYGHINSTANNYAILFDREFVPIDESQRDLYKVLDLFIKIFQAFKNLFWNLFVSILPQ